MALDLKRELGTYSARRGRFDLLTVPPVRVLAVDGHGDPNTSSAYADAVATIYPAAYALKFLSKRELDRDWTMMPLEALWSATDMAAFTTSRDASRWDWTLLVVVPGWITSDHLAVALHGMATKRPVPAVDRLRLETFDEGPAVQTLHVGPYDAEGPVLQELHDTVVPSRSLRMTGRHHEIYLNDPRRTAAERLRTILRQPVAPLTTG